jgi:hypothetical protein
LPDPIPPAAPATSAPPAGVRDRVPARPERRLPPRPRPGRSSGATRSVRTLVRRAHKPRAGMSSIRVREARPRLHRPAPA